MRTETDLALAKLIRAGDGIESQSGVIRTAYEATHVGTGTSFWQATVAVVGDTCIYPVHTYAIWAVWRNSVCIWRRGESLVQRSMFEAVQA